jgi:hypothetical protein
VSVLSSLKMMRGFEPAKLFFIFPASIAILGSITSVFGAVSERFMPLNITTAHSSHRLRQLLLNRCAVPPPHEVCQSPTHLGFIQTFFAVASCSSIFDLV